MYVAIMERFQNLAPVSSVHSSQKYFFHKTRDAEMPIMVQLSKAFIIFKFLFPYNFIPTSNKLISY